MCIRDRYVDGTDTGIVVNLRHKSHPLVREFEKTVTKEQLDFSDGNKTQDQFSELIRVQGLRKRFVSIDSWQWPDDATFHGEKPELTLEFVSRLCAELAWFRTELDKHLGNEQAFHPKLSDASAKA